MKPLSSFVAIVLGLVLNSAVYCNGGKTSVYVRKVEKTEDMPLNSDVFRVPPGYNAPQQVHITQDHHDGKAVIVSWVTEDEPGSSAVFYWSENTKHKEKGSRQIRYSTTFSGSEWKITKRALTIARGKKTGTLYYNTRYYYEVGLDHTRRTFWFTTPPSVGPNVPYAFGLIGDLGQSFDSNSTLTHYEQIHRKVRWVKISLLSLTLTGIMFLSEHRTVPHRFGKCTPQYQWLEAELPKVNRSETPWLIVLMHSPWYKSYNYHYMEGESMRERISNIAYNVVNGICIPVKDQSAPVYITIGDRGNLEGLATNMTEPQPAYSAYREASFGHAIFDIKNRTHAYCSWHRNHDGYAVEADSMWVFNRFWHPVDETSTSQ
ncbi:purple acid phosphatase 2-like [Hibiscus syriacus]|uniref:purple acid phosphatase 2-like n=1 Tax=Hibiscus syriacus TaxID=106335 RepID=UPI001923C5AD|nr:purple acid phosphatase 2-like [Hibiscus syriacus]